ncbi:hypothetical protein CJU89_1399 [Yarrowia sp. B02]|nr:hypothetical protein CJU89_1399 [Yarrowia sp. B02]
MPPDEECLARLQAAWSRLDPLNKGTILAGQMLAAVDAIEISFGMVPGKFISRRGRQVIAEFATENPKKRVSLEKMVELFDAFDKSVELEQERSVREWASQRQEEYSDYDYGDAQRVSEIPPVNLDSPPASPRADHKSFPDILGDLPHVLPELDRHSPSRGSAQPPLSSGSASSAAKFYSATISRPATQGNGKSNGMSPNGTSPNGKAPIHVSRRPSVSRSSPLRPATSGSNQTLAGDLSLERSRSSPLRTSRRSWAKSNDEAFFERMRKDDDDEDASISFTDGDTDSLMRINHKHMSELHQLREYADYCETQMEDSEQRHVDLEASILAKTKECREHVSRTKAHQEGLEQVSQMISELTEMLGRKSKRNSRTGSISSNPDSELLDAYKSRLEEQLAALGKSGELQEAEIKRLTEEKSEQQKKVEALEGQFKSLTENLSKVTDDVAREREDFLDFEARLKDKQPEGDFSSIGDILEQQNLIINDLKEKLLKRVEQKEEVKETAVEPIVHEPIEKSSVSTGLKNMLTILLMVVAFHVISETFFPSNLPEGVLWWMNAPAPIQRVFGALDSWVARHDDFRVPM